jgi:hypothetical protein
MRLRVNAPPPGLPPQLNGRSKGANLVVGVIFNEQKASHFGAAAASAISVFYP